ncbi:MAG: hydrogenase nickel incorporation protein HypB [Actinobacteria bacterium]|nr:hydrogenase nickel incorporation protein HypB [Actinomycetota bacterium]
MEIKVLEGVFDANEIVAKENRGILDKSGTYMVNMMASPGAGKTSLVVKTLEGLSGDLKAVVIEGDIAGKVDAERVSDTGTEAIQINTGGSCHLEAKQVNTALMNLNLEGIGLAIVENVGNLVCPAEFKLGEDLKVMILSVAEGDDKPLKYPLMFSESDVLIVNKIDLIPYTNFNLDKLKDTVKKMNPDVTIFEVSCTNGDGIPEWVEWLKSRVLG